MTIFDILSVQTMFKYEEMNRMLYNSSLKSRSIVNVFINLEYMITNLQSSRFCDIDKELATKCDMRNIVSDIFSIVSHYRNYFIYYDIYPRIYLYMTDPDSNDFIEKTYNPNFRNRYNRECQNELCQETLETFKKSFSIIQTICKYIDDVSLIISKNIDSSLIPYIVSINNHGRYRNIIIDNDSVNDVYYSLPNTLRRIKVKRRLHKRYGEYNFQELLSYEYKISNFNLYLHNPLFVAAIISCINRENIRGIPNILGYGTAALTKDIIKGIDNGIITDRTQSIELFQECITEKYRDGIINNMKQIDIPYRYHLLNPANINSIMSQVVNLYDVEGLKEISKSVFTDYQLDLYKLIKKPNFMNRR